MMKSKRLSFFCLTMITLIIGALLLQSKTAPAAPDTVNAAPRPQAKVALLPTEVTALSLALGHTPLCTQRVEGIDHGRPGVGFVGPDFSAGIDNETGILTDFFRSGTGDSGITGAPLLTSQEAQARAETFLRQASLQVEGVWTLKTSKYHAVGPGFRQYEFDWVKMFHGIKLPAMILITVNADSGNIIEYKLIDDPVVVSLQANLTAEDAVQVLVRKKAWTHPIVRKAELLVWYKGGYPGPQALLWSVEVANPDAQTGADSISKADIDAVSGQIDALFSPLGFFQIEPHSEDAKSIALPKPDLKALRTAKVPPTVFQLAERKKAK